MEDGDRHETLRGDMLRHRLTFHSTADRVIFASDMPTAILPGTCDACKNCGGGKRTTSQPEMEEVSVQMLTTDADENAEAVIAYRLLSAVRAAMLVNPSRTIRIAPSDTARGAAENWQLRASEEDAPRVKAPPPSGETVYKGEVHLDSGGCTAAEELTAELLGAAISSTSKQGRREQTGVSGFAQRSCFDDELGGRGESLCPTNARDDSSYTHGSEAPDKLGKVQPSTTTNTHSRFSIPQPEVGTPLDGTMVGGTSYSLRLEKEDVAPDESESISLYDQYHRAVSTEDSAANVRHGFRAAAQTRRLDTVGEGQNHQPAISIAGRAKCTADSVERPQQPIFHNDKVQGKSAVARSPLMFECTDRADIVVGSTGNDVCTGKRSCSEIKSSLPSERAVFAQARRVVAESNAGKQGWQDTSVCDTIGLQRPVFSPGTARHSLLEQSSPWGYTQESAVDGSTCASRAEVMSTAHWEGSDLIAYVMFVRKGNSSR